MKLPANPWQNFSTNQRIIFILASLCFVGLIVLGGLALALRSRLQEMASIVPTQVCRPSTLVLGERIFQIQILPLGSGGLSNLPADAAGIACWVDGTQVNPVFLLSPTPENLDMVSTINLGSEVTATWSDCTVTSYQISAHEPSTFQASSLPDQSQEGITVFFPIDASGAGFVFTAGLSSEQVHVLNGPTAAVESTLHPSVTNPIPTSVENTTTPSLVPTEYIPTVDCDSPTLTLGTSMFQIQELVVAPDESLTIPSDSAGIAYWLESADGNHLFVLSPTTENISLAKTLTEGMTAEVTWTDCSSLTFDLSIPSSNSQNISEVMDELTSGITVFFETDSSGEGITITGDLTELTFPQ